MPRVSQEHLDARRRQILDAARRCFARNGFHATSMQDVLTEADLSAGAVYRYFDGKAAIVFAIVDETLAEIEAVFAEVAGRSEPPPIDEALGTVLRALERLDEEHGVAKLAVQVWGEAVREPALAVRFGETFGRVHAWLVVLVESYQRCGAMPGDVAADDAARVLATLGPGFVLQRALIGGTHAATFATGIRALALMR